MVVVKMAVTFDSIKLSQALSSRLCHELSGIAGSISTTVELTYSSDKNIEIKAKDVLNSTSKQFTNILKFYKFTYGFCSKNSQIELIELKQLCESIIDNKIDVNFVISKQQSIDSELAKAILCLIISSTRLIIKSGSISVSFNQNIAIRAHSQYLKKEPKKIDILLGEHNHQLLDIDNSHEFYTYYLINKLGLNVEVEQTHESITYSIS